MVSVLAGGAVLILLLRDIVRPVRPLAALAVAAVIWGWAIAQYPHVLPPRLTIAAAAAPAATEAAELVVVGIIVVLVVPSFAVLFRLAQSGRLGEAEATSASLLAGGTGRPETAGRSPGGSAVMPPTRHLGLATAVVVGMVTVKELRQLRKAVAERGRSRRLPRRAGGRDNSRTCPSLAGGPAFAACRLSRCGITTYFGCGCRKSHPRYATRRYS